MHICVCERAWALLSIPILIAQNEEKTTNLSLNKSLLFIKKKA